MENAQNCDKMSEDHTYNPYKNITDEPIPPSFDTPESYNQLNSILSYYNIPLIQSSDSIIEKANALKKIQEILSERYQEKFKDIKICDEHVFSMVERIEQSKLTEISCDRMEVELANQKVEVSHKFLNKSVEELQQELEQLKKELEHRKVSNIKNEYSLMRTITDEILMGKSYDSLSFMKDKTKAQYLKMKILDKLRGIDDDCSKVLFKIVECGTCNMEEIRHDLKIDRVNLLRIIYSFSAKEILEYDRLNDSVSIKSREA